MKNLLYNIGKVIEKWCPISAVCPKCDTETSTEIDFEIATTQWQDMLDKIEDEIKEHIIESASDVAKEAAKVLTGVIVDTLTKED